MEYSLLDFNQQKAIKLGLDDRDLLILDFLRKNNNQYNFFYSRSRLYIKKS